YEQATPRSGATTQDESAPAAVDALDALSLAEVEETAGELHRRIGVALRLMGERRADRTGTSGRSARWHAASLVAATELAATVLGAAAVEAEAPLPRLDRQAPSIGAVMYAAPTLAGLTSRLEQDRRLLVSLARSLESRLDDERETPWGHVRLRRVV